MGRLGASLLELVAGSRIATTADYSSTVLVEGGSASREAKIAFRLGDVVRSGAVPEIVADVVRQWGIVNAVGIEAGPLEGPYVPGAPGAAIGFAAWMVG